jgi:glycosyltransferase involved in cell wall biosynthesis
MAPIARDIPVHLAVVTLAFEGGGPERDMVLLCNAVAARGVKIDILALRDQGPLRSLVDPGIRVVAIQEPRIRYALPALRRALRSLSPTIVISSGVPSLNLVTLIAARTLPREVRPKIVMREAAVPSMAHHDPSRSNRLAYFFLHLLYRYADRVITLTEGARRDLTKLFSVPDSRISVMRTNAVLAPNVVQSIMEWDGKSGRENNLIVCMGRLSAEKDHQLLFRALTMLPADQSWRLAVVGDGPDRASLEALARENKFSDRIFFTGYVMDPFVWMKRASVVVLPSLYEGFGNVIIEALACGTPVICTDCPYGPREILAGGRYGTLTPAGDAAAMASAISAALNGTPDRHALKQRGLEYTSEHAAGRFLQIVTDLQPTVFERVP